jgi:hypothetical protein
MAMVGHAAEDPAVEAFSQRVDQYVKIRDASRQKVPGLPKDATPEQIQKHEQALVVEIRTVREGAKPGDVFAADVRPLFLKILKENFAGPANKEARETARQGNPGRELEKGESAPAILVNAVYPKSAPLSSVPPLLLLQLPKLPKDVEYRFSGQTLLLFDSLSNLIIDFMKGAAPGV